MEGYEMINIPSEEDFARADAYMREVYRNIDQADKSASQYFREICQEHSHYFYLLPEGEKEFRAYIFYKNNKDIAIYKANGIEKKMEDFIYAELERQGRGKKEDITVAFEFDSDENVTAKFGGDYFLRLR
jgi:hypothetical protein